MLSRGVSWHSCMAFPHALAPASHAARPLGVLEANTAICCCGQQYMLLINSTHTCQLNETVTPRNSRRRGRVTRCTRSYATGQQRSTPHTRNTLSCPDRFTPLTSAPQKNSTSVQLTHPQQTFCCPSRRANRTHILCTTAEAVGGCTTSAPQHNCLRATALLHSCKLRSNKP